MIHPTIANNFARGGKARYSKLSKGVLNNECKKNVIPNGVRNLEIYPYIQAWRFLTPFGMTGKRALRYGKLLYLYHSC
jgi:hypothetical protein